MGVAASIVSIVLKSVVGDKLGSGLVKEIADISIDGVSEKGINEINDFINGKKSKIDNIFSKENMKSMGILENNINYVKAEIKDLLSKIDITDEVLSQCKYNSKNLFVFLVLKYYENKKEGCIECEGDIKKCLFALAEVLFKLARESEDFEEKVLIHISNSVDNTNVELQKISEYLNNNFGKLNAYNQTILEILQMILEQNQESAKIKDKQKKSRTQEYADKWEANMFLNNFDKRDKKSGVNVKLREVYLEKHLPHYIWGDNDENEPSTDLKELLSEYINVKRDSKMLIILGQPGIGKSTLITWITANFRERFDDIFVYSFASDLGNTDWQNGRISNRVLEELGLSHSDLNGKILIIDGFDEVSIESNRRRDILDSLYIDWINNKAIENFSLIITCRENYINRFEKIKCQYIILQAWDENQIRSFCNKFQEKTKDGVSENTVKILIGNMKILGFPLILYMTLALNISIDKEGSIVDIYDKIFSLEGGIYDRCIDNKMFADKHRIGEVKEFIHQISRDIAIWMFENNPNTECIPHEEYQKICGNVIQKQVQYNANINQDFLIGNFFKLVKHCDGIETEELYFVHRSIYEYFVAEAIYNSIEKAIMDLTEKSQEDLAKNIAFYLKEGEISPTIGEYLQHKIIKLYKKMNHERKQRFYLWWENTVDKMMKMGMFYYTNRNIRDYKNIIDKENNCFCNLMEILRLLLITTDRKYIMESVNTSRLVKYITLKKSCHNLNKIYLKNVDLRGIILREFNLQEADLCNANLQGADLSECKLRNADLREANLEMANLCNADLRGANLQGAKLEKVKMASARIDGNIKQYIEQNYNEILSNLAVQNTYVRNDIEEN